MNRRKRQLAKPLPLFLYVIMAILTWLARSANSAEASSINETKFEEALLTLMGSFTSFGMTANMTAAALAFNECLDGANSASSWSSSGSSYGPPKVIGFECFEGAVKHGLMNTVDNARQGTWHQKKAKKRVTSRGTIGEDGPVIYFNNSFSEGLTPVEKLRISTSCSLDAGRNKGESVVFSGPFLLDALKAYKFYQMKLDGVPVGQVCLTSNPKEWDLGLNITAQAGVMVANAKEIARMPGGTAGTLIPTAQFTRDPTGAPSVVKHTKAPSQSSGSSGSANGTNGTIGLQTTVQEASGQEGTAWFFENWFFFAGGGGALAMIAVVYRLYRRRAHEAAAQAEAAKAREAEAKEAEAKAAKAKAAKAAESEPSPRSTTPEPSPRSRSRTPPRNRSATPPHVGEHSLGGSPAMNDVADAKEGTEDQQAENLFAEAAVAAAMSVTDGLAAEAEITNAAQNREIAKNKMELDALKASFGELQLLSPRSKTVESAQARVKEAEAEAKVAIAKAEAEAEAAKAEAIVLAAKLHSPRSKIEQKNINRIDSEDIQKIENLNDVYEKDMCYLTLLKKAIMQNKVEQLYVLIIPGHQPSQEPEPELRSELSELDEVKNKLHELVRMVELSKLILKKVLKSEDSQDFFKFLDNIIENAQKIQEGVQGREKEAAEAQQELGSDKKNSVNDDTFCRAIREAVVEAKERLEKECRGQSFSNEPQKEIIKLILAKFDLPTPKAETKKKRNRERLVSSSSVGDFRMDDILRQNQQWLKENIEILKENHIISEEDESSLLTKFKEAGGSNFAELKEMVSGMLAQSYDEKIKPLMEMTEGGQDVLVADVLFSAEKINSKIRIFQDQMEVRREVEEKQGKALRSLGEQLTESYQLQVDKAVKSIGRLKGEFQDVRNIAKSTKFFSSVSGDGKILREKKIIYKSFEASKEPNSEITNEKLLESLFFHCFKEASQDEAKVKALEELGITAAKKTHDLLSKFTSEILSDDTVYQSFIVAITAKNEKEISVPTNREEKLEELTEQIRMFCCGESQSQPEPAMMSP